MIQFGAPGVYVVEASSGVRPITTVVTSIAAFVDYFAEGPLDTAVQIFGLADFERIYGGVDPNSVASYAIRQFFLNGGSSAYVIRAMAQPVLPAPPFAAAGIDINEAGAGANTTVLAASPGIWGNNVRVTVTSPGGTTGATPGPFNMTVVRYASSRPNAKAIASEQYLGLSAVVGDPRNYLIIVNAGSSLVTLTRDGTATAAAVPATNGSLGNDLSALTPANIKALENTTFSVVIGTAGNQSAARTATIGLFPGANPTLSDLRDAVGRAIQSAPSSSDTPWDQAFGSVSVELAGTQLLIRSSRTAATYNPEETIQIGGADAGVLGFVGALVNVQEYWLGTSTGAGEVNAVIAGVDGLQPGTAELVGIRALQTGMYALEPVDMFNILCIPRAADLADSAMTSVVSQAIAYCGERRALLLVDIPETVETVQQMQDWLNAHTFRDGNAVIYFPRLWTPDPANDYRDKNVASSGTIAGLYSRTDVTRGVWKAPAGIDATLRGVTRVDLKLTDPQNGVLNPLGINCLRAFPVYGNVCWGARTLVGADVLASEWKYVPIRRLALMIEESLFRGTKWVVFEPNDEPLWAKIRQNVGAFMLQLFRQGAFQGSTPATAFYVKCDGETTTANDRNAGIVNIEVGFAPLKPAEFVVVTIRQIPDITSAS